MRIFFKTTAHPKKVAKRIQAMRNMAVFAGTPGATKDGLFTLSRSKEIAARLFGYADWHELERVAASGANPPSPLDEDLSLEEQKARTSYQAKVLRETLQLVSDLSSATFIEELRPSAKSRWSEQLLSDDDRKNHIAVRAGFAGEPDLYAFRPAYRGKQFDDELEYLLRSWENREIDSQAVCTRVDAILKQQPENTNAMWLFLKVVYGDRTFELARSKLPVFAAAVRAMLPPGLSTKRKGVFSWDDLDSRDFLRLISMLAVCSLMLNELGEARFWLQFSKDIGDDLRDWHRQFWKELQRREML